MSAVRALRRQRSRRAYELGSWQRFVGRRDDMEVMMTEFEKLVIAEAKLLCRARCRSVNCVDAKQCRNIWPGPGGTLSIYLKEARERVRTQQMDAA